MTLVGLGTAAVLMLVGVLHGVWMFSPWPLRTREEFASRVVGVPVEKLPTGPATGVVAVLLGVAAYVVAGRAGVLPVPGPGWLATAGAAGVAAVLLLRGGTGGVVPAGHRVRPPRPADLLAAVPRPGGVLRVGRRSGMNLPPCAGSLIRRAPPSRR